jgi:phosphate:Na+ symporter
MMTLWISFLSTIVGGLGLFMLGMKLLAEGTQSIAGPRLTRLVSAVTDNRVLAALVGIGVTATLQSSSATSVMLVGFVNAGIMTLSQAVGVLMGANIGSTVTAWIMTLNLAKYGLAIGGVGALIFVFSRGERTRYLAMVTLGLGLLFYGLQLMGEGFAPLQQNDSVRAWLLRFDASAFPGFLACLLAGLVLTAIIQSSGAMVGIAMTLTAGGFITFPAAVAIALGADIGTTVTGLIACIGAKRAAIRTALANTLIRALGVVVILPFAGWFVSFCEWFSGVLAGSMGLAASSAASTPYPLFSVAVAHTLFNLATTAIDLPLLDGFVRVLERIVPVLPAEKQKARRHETHLDRRLLTQPAIALAESQREIGAMGATCRTMLADFRVILAAGGEGSEAAEDEVFALEEDLDVAQKNISEFVTQLLSSRGLPGEDAVKIRRQLRQADEYESVSDYVRNALKAFLKIRNAGEELSETAKCEVENLCEKTDEFMRMVGRTLERNDPREVPMARMMAQRHEDYAKECRAAHMDRITKTCLTPVKSLVYSDLLVAFRRMNDHLLNIAETLEPLRF